MKKYFYVEGNASLCIVVLHPVLPLIIVSKYHRIGRAHCASLLQVTSFGVKRHAAFNISFGKMVSKGFIGLPKGDTIYFYMVL